MSKKCTPLWREAHFEVTTYKTHHSWSTFGSCDVEEVHAVVARSTCPSQNVQNTSASEHFRKLGRRKSACRCGAKHILSQNVEITTCSGHFWKLRGRKSARCCGAKHVRKSTCLDRFWTFRCRFFVASPRDCAPCHECGNVTVL